MSLNFRAALIPLLAFLLCSMVCAGEKISLWEPTPNKVLNDLLYSENGEVISVNDEYDSGAFISYFIKTPTHFYRCIDDLDANPRKKLEVDKTQCYVLVRPK